MIETLNANPGTVSSSRPGPLGVVGGMGSLATAVFLQILARRSPAKRDQDHVPVLLLSLPDIPDRSRSILNAERSAADRILERIAWLDAAGCGAIAIPCNTAHYWQDEFAAATTTPFISMIDATRSEIESRFGHPVEDLSILTIGTPATIQYDIHPRFRRAKGPQGRLPQMGDDGTTDERIECERARINALTLDVIRAVKAGHGTRAVEALHQVIGLARRLRPDAVILGCSELSVLAADLTDEPDIVDPLTALADRCEAWWRAPIQHCQFRGQKLSHEAALGVEPMDNPSPGMGGLL